MLTGEYRFHCHFTSPAFLPEFKGSMLRGGFGRALKSVACALRQKKCENCLLAPTCVYALIFHLLVRAALRRVSTLENGHGNGEPDLDYPGLVKRAGAITIKNSDCRWQELTRYSNRQQTAMLLGGLQGSIEYQGDLTEFVPLLRYCETVHLGKQTTFGLGRIEVLATA